jgi:plastocyanin
METSIHETTHEGTSGAQSSGKMPIIFGVVVILLILAGGAFVMSKKETQPESTKVPMESASPSSSEKPAEQGNPLKMNMDPQSPPPMTEQQKMQMTDGTSTKVKEKKFDITGGNFYFSPNEMTVNKGDKVTITFSNAGGIHDFVIDEFKAKTETIETGETSTVTFVANKAGSFQFYCSVPGHLQKGMKGTLIVK